MQRAILAAAAITASAWTSPVEARLVNQFLRGEDRICVYDNPTGEYTDRVEKSVRIPGEGDCPAEPLLPSVPSLATLTATVEENGQRICTYRYLGRNYVRILGAGQYCTYTPL